MNRCSHGYILKKTISPFIIHDINNIIITACQDSVDEEFEEE